MRLLLKIIKQAGTGEDRVLIPDLPAHSVEMPLPIKGEDGTLLPDTAPVQSAVYDSWVRRAQEEGEGFKKRMMDLAHQEREEILAQARVDAESIKAQACQEGFRQGVQEKKEEVDALLRDMDRAMAEIKLQHQAFLEEYAGKLGELSLDVAEKILRHQLDRDDTAMADLVQEAVANVKNVGWLTVALSGRMTGLLERLEQVVPSVDPVDGRRIELQGKELPDGSCIIDTPLGQLDASISTQLDNLRACFKEAQ